MRGLEMKLRPAALTWASAELGSSRSTRFIARVKHGSLTETCFRTWRNMACVVQDMLDALFATLTCARCPAKIDVTPEVRVQSTSMLYTLSGGIAYTNGPQKPWQSHARRLRVKYVRGALTTSSPGRMNREYTVRLAKDSLANPPQKCSLSAT
jgi:hypothetical protein